MQIIIQENMRSVFDIGPIIFQFFLFNLLIELTQKIKILAPMDDDVLVFNKSAKLFWDFRLKLEF